jgi:hypothetical protein
MNQVTVTFKKLFDNESAANVAFKPYNVDMDIDMYFEATEKNEGDNTLYFTNIQLNSDVVYDIVRAADELKRIMMAKEDGDSIKDYLNALRMSGYDVVIE